LGVIEQLYLNKSVAVMQSIVFFSCLFFSLWWFLSWKLKKAAVERELPELKKYFIIMLALMLVAEAMIFWETEMMWSKAYLIEIPYFIFQIMGLMLTHGYIASLSSPDGRGQPEDLNRIQFNP